MPTKSTDPISLLDHLLRCADGDWRLREPLVNIESIPANIADRTRGRVRSNGTRRLRQVVPRGRCDTLSRFKMLGLRLWSACLAEEVRRICPRVATGESTEAARNEAARDEARYMLRLAVDFAEADEIRGHIAYKINEKRTGPVCRQERRRGIRIAKGPTVRPGCELHSWAAYPKTACGKSEFLAELSLVIERLLGNPAEDGAVVPDAPPAPPIAVDKPDRNDGNPPKSGGRGPGSVNQRPNAGNAPIHARLSWADYRQVGQGVGVRPVDDRRNRDMEDAGSGASDLKSRKGV